MRIFVYKRTHNGDPDANGNFGVWDCMGTMRDNKFDAVIGVGGTGADAIRHGIAGRINWVGIGPHRKTKRCGHGSMVTIINFDCFVAYETEILNLREKAPALAKRMYDGNVRHLMVENRRFPELHSEAMRILDAAKKRTATKVGAAKPRKRTSCVSKRRRMSCKS